MRVLHVVKTSDGAIWAARQVAELVRLGIEAHVAVPDACGEAMPVWEGTGAHIHIASLDAPVGEPWSILGVSSRARELVADVAPDLIHSHFVGTTLVIRTALGRRCPIPRIFQVPGPLHLEHRLYRELDLRTARECDYWIGSSRYIIHLYRQGGVESSKIFLSYYGARPEEHLEARGGFLRERLGISAAQLVIGNISILYRPKYYLGQRVGVKGHEDVVKALAIVLRRRPDAVGVLAGGPWMGAERYFERVRRRALGLLGDRVRMPGALPHDLVCRAWPDFDCAVHVPLSENCGGVVEPLLASVPTIAGRVGGLPEVVIEGVTGTTVEVRDPATLAARILEVLEHLGRYRQMARVGRELVREMFDVRRTAREVFGIYRHILYGEPRPAEFDSLTFASNIQENRACVAVQ